MAKSGLTFNHRSEVLSGMEADLRARIEAFSAAYEASGEIPNLEQLQTLFLNKEWLMLLYSQPSVPPTSFAKMNTVFDEHANAIRQLFDDLRMQEQDPNNNVRILVCVKAAIRQYMDMQHSSGEAQYHEKYSSIYDPICTGKYQCRSATQLAIILLRRWHVLSGDAVLVNMYPNRHTFPAVIQADQSIHGVEMTTRGASVVDCGALPSVTRSGVAVRVVHADHSLAQAVTGRRSHVNTSLLANSVTGEVINGAIIMNEEARSAPDVYGWGERFSYPVNPDQILMPVDGLSLYDYHGSLTDSLEQNMSQGAFHITYYVVEEAGHEYQVLEALYRRPDSDEAIVVFQIPAFADATIRSKYAAIIAGGTEHARRDLTAISIKKYMSMPQVRIVRPEDQR